MNPTEDDSLADWERELLLANYPDLKEGDLVRFSSGERKIEGRLVYPGGRRLLYVDAGRSVGYYRDRFWQVTIVEKAKPKLPTIEGFYLDREGDVWELDGNLWHCVGEGLSGAESARDYLPLRRLIPEEVSA